MSVENVNQGQEKISKDVRELSDHINAFLDEHFAAGRTLEQLTEMGNKVDKGQHQATWLMRPQLPATRPATFIIKTQGKDYGRPDEDLYVEGLTMLMVKRTTDIPVPHIYALGKTPPRTADEASGPVFLAMEYIEGQELYEFPRRWTEEEKNNFIRQMAMIRIEMLRSGADSIGGVLFAPKPAEVKPGLKNIRNPMLTAGAMGGHIWYAAGRHIFSYDEKNNRGPYKRTKDWVEASLTREILHYSKVQSDNPTALPTGKPIPPLILAPTYNFAEHKPTLGWVDKLRELRSSIRRMESNSDLTKDDGFFPLTHGDLFQGSNIMVRGAKIASIIDWETANLVPFSEAMQDLTVLDENKYPMLPLAISGVNAIEYNYNLMEYNSQIGSDEDMDDGVSMYAHSDEEGADDKIEQAELLDGDWYEQELIPQVYHLVHQWFTKYDPTYSLQLLKQNDLVIFACRNHIEAGGLVPEFYPQE